MLWQFLPMSSLNLYYYFGFSNGQAISNCFYSLLQYQFRFVFLQEVYTVKVILLVLLFFLFSVIILPQYFRTMDSVILVLISITSILLIVFLAPLPSSQRPIQSIKRKKRLKWLAVFFTLVWQGVLWFLIQDTVFFSCGIWTIFLQSIQLLWKFSSHLERGLYE